MLAKKRQVLGIQWLCLVVMVTAAGLLVPQNFSLDQGLEVCIHDKVSFRNLSGGGGGGGDICFKR